MIEIEVKIKIKDREEFKRNISEAGANLSKDRHFEENTLYDFPDKSLYRKGCAFRLRTVHKKSFLTFKGPHQKSRKFKVREEYETEVRNGKQMKHIIKLLGLVPTFSYCKYRTVYRKKNLTICLDELDIGTYAEFEGEKNKIVKFAQSVGISKKEFITLDYIQLIQKNRKK
ncbi:MAG: class IV adenylate cyclase [Candidatus Aminicenantes bacterium]|nr:class IV adenylate cyclase [Candidatus Aminicenantes bacterium]